VVGGCYILEEPKNDLLAGMYEIQVKNIQAVVNEIAELEEYSTVCFF
jgi:hypothetical protein